MFRTIIQFFNDVKVEFTKVSWPTREELVQSTIVVIVVSTIVAIFIGTVDLGLQKLMTFFFGMV